MIRLGRVPACPCNLSCGHPNYHVNLTKLKLEVVWKGGLPTFTWTLQVFKMCTCGCTVYFHNHIWPTFVILTAIVFRSYYYYYYYYYCFFFINIINKTLFIDLKIDYLQIQEYEILKYIPYVHSSCVRKRIVVKWLSKDY